MQQPRDPRPLLTSPSPPAVGKVNNNNNNSTTVNNNNNNSSPPTWHPHVYGKPPRSPTPHRIVDILGWMKEASRVAAAGGVLAPKPKPLRVPANVLIVPRVPMSQHPAPLPGPPADDPDEPLNLTTRSRDASPTPGTPPLGASPLAATPLAATPLGASPLGATLLPPRPFREPLNGLPPGLSPALLNGRIPDMLPTVRVPAVPIRGE